MTMLANVRNEIKTFIDPLKFRDWLKPMPADTICGISDSECECPFSRYLRSRIRHLPELWLGHIYVLEYPDLLVGTNADYIGVSTSEEYEDFKTEPWLRDFMRGIDGVFDDEQEHLPEERAISAGEALEVLEGVIAKLNSKGETDGVI